MAEYLMHDWAKENDLDLIVGSKGLHWEGRITAVQQSMERVGIDISDHVPTLLTPSDLASTDLIITMAPGLSKQVAYDVSSMAKGKTYTLPEILESQWEDVILDPMLARTRLGYKIYDTCRDTIAVCVDALGSLLKGELFDAERLNFAFANYRNMMGYPMPKRRREL